MDIPPTSDESNCKSAKLLWSHAACKIFLRRTDASVNVMNQLSLGRDGLQTYLKHAAVGYINYPDAFSGCAHPFCMDEPNRRNSGRAEFSRPDI